MTRFICVAMAIVTCALQVFAIAHSAQYGFSPHTHTHAHTADVSHTDQAHTADVSHTDQAPSTGQHDLAQQCQLHLYSETASYTHLHTPSTGPSAFQYLTSPHSPQTYGIPTAQSSDNRARAPPAFA